MGVKMKKEYRFEVRNGENIISRHTTFANAERSRNRKLAWRCGICGNNKSGWGSCNHGSHNRVCNAGYYNSKIVQIA